MRHRMTYIAIMPTKLGNTCKIRNETNSVLRQGNLKRENTYADSEQTTTVIRAVPTAMISVLRNHST